MALIHDVASQVAYSAQCNLMNYCLLNIEDIAEKMLSHIRNVTLKLESFHEHDANADMILLGFSINSSNK